jgi:hypothetical protein
MINLSYVALGLCEPLATGRRAPRLLRLVKSRRRDTRALDYETYGLVDPIANTVVCGWTTTGYGLSLDEIDHELCRVAVGAAEAPVAANPPYFRRPPGVRA